MATSFSADPQIAALMQEAARHAQSGREAEASRIFQAVLRLDPAQPVALNALGMMALKAGDGAAVALFDRATQSDPDATALWLNLATAARMQQDHELEHRALSGALGVDRRHIMANFRLAELFERQGKPDEALPHWQGLVMMLGQTADGVPQLVDILERARSQVAVYQECLSRELDSALAADRGRYAVSERRRVEACVDVMLGRKRVYVNECHGLHFPFLPADEYFDRAHFPWLEALEKETDAIRAECEALLADPDSGFTPYVTLDSGSPDNLWTPLDGSQQWTSRHLWQHGERIDDVCARCPRTAAALESIPRAHLMGRMPTAFFSILQPKTRLPAHTGVSNVRAIVHLPLVVPPKCGFRVGGETRVWRVGEAFVFDDTIEHEAWNDSDAVRAVLIFDVWNPYLTTAEQSMLQTIFAQMHRAGLSAQSMD